MAYHDSALTADAPLIFVNGSTGKEVVYWVNFATLGLSSWSWTVTVGSGVVAGTKFGGYSLNGAAAGTLPATDGTHTWTQTGGPAPGDTVTAGQSWTVTATQTGYGVNNSDLTLQIGEDLGTGSAVVRGIVRLAAWGSGTPGRFYGQVDYDTPYEVPNTWGDSGFLAQPILLPNISNAGYDDGFGWVYPPDPYPTTMLLRPFYAASTAIEAFDYDPPTGTDWTLTIDPPDPATDVTAYVTATFEYSGDYSPSLTPVRFAGVMVPVPTQSWGGGDPLPAIDRTANPELTAPFDVTLNLAVNYVPPVSGGIFHGHPIGAGFSGVVVAR